MSNDKADLGASAVVADLNQLREDVAHMKDALAELIRGEAGQASATLRGAVKGAKRQMSQTAANAQDSALSAAADFERRIEKNPLTAVLIAGGIGLMLGVMSRPR
jgi:ElaB/YqjD/DUF883 family membrane-anchored ribosome-binding protein